MLNVLAPKKQLQTCETKTNKNERKNRKIYNDS